MRLAQLKLYLRSMLLGSGLCLLASCAAWKSGQDNTAAIIDGNPSLASGAQPTGLGEEPSVESNAASNTGDQYLNKRTYYFDFDKSNVRSEDMPAIDANADYLINHPNAKILLEGHTDPRGSREYNIALGERRARAVRELMEEKGVKPSQLRIISYGAEKLASNGRSENNYQLDRRAVVVYLQQ